MRGILRAARILTKVATHPPTLPSPAGTVVLPSTPAIVKSPVTLYRIACKTFEQNTITRELLKNKPEVTCFNGMLSMDLIVKGIDQQVLLELVGANRVSKVSPAI